MGFIVRRTYAPIPDARVRWQATGEEYQGGDPIGHGATPGAALDDLIDDIKLRKTPQETLDDIVVEIDATFGAAKMTTEIRELRAALRQAHNCVAEGHRRLTRVGWGDVGEFNEKTLQVIENALKQESAK